MSYFGASSEGWTTSTELPPDSLELPESDSDSDAGSDGYVEKLQRQSLGPSGLGSFVISSSMDKMPSRENSCDSILSLDEDSLGRNPSDLFRQLSSASSYSDDEEETITLTPEELAESESEMIQSVSGTCNLSEQDAQLLLQGCDWNQQALLDRYFSEPPAKLFAEFGIEPPKEKEVAVDTGRPGRQESDPGDEPGECDICMDDDKPIITTRCGHSACPDCISNHVKGLVASNVVNVTCFLCETVLSREIVQRHVSDDITMTKWKKLVAESHVMKNNRLKWCPGADCGCAIQYSQPIEVARGPFMVKCGKSSCGNSFCFGCSADEDHTPMPCAMLAMWDKQCQKDSENLAWIVQNTRDCPKCGTPVEKNGGCNSVECRCGHTFCWVCLQVHSNMHTFDKTCSRWNAEAKARMEKMMANRDISQRYVHYFERFTNHAKSLALEKKGLEPQLKVKAPATQPIFAAAIKALRQARVILKNTYAFAYYLKPSGQRTIFEDNQEDVESYVEGLSGYLEKGMLTEEIQSKCHKTILNLIELCSTRTETLVEHVQDGYEVGDWRFQQVELHYAGWAASTGSFAREYRMKGMSASAKIYKSHSADTNMPGCIISPKGGIGQGGAERRIEVVKVHEEKAEEGKEPVKWLKLSPATIDTLVEEMGGAKAGGKSAQELNDVNKEKEGWVLAKQLMVDVHHRHGGGSMPMPPEVEWTKIEMAKSPTGGGGGGSRSGGGGGGGAKGGGGSAKAGAGAGPAMPAVLLTSADWQCAKCTYVNAKTSPNCEMCNEKQP